MGSNLAKHKMTHKSNTSANLDRERNINEDSSTNGNIYPVDIISKFTFTTAINFKPELTNFIEFNPRTSFNGIRTDFARNPILLQSPQDNAELCNYTNKHDPKFEQIDILGLNSTICQHVLKFTEGGWADTVLINNKREGASHPIHQHGGWFWIVGEGQFNKNIYRQLIKDL